jgi:formylglycine-generating enzyme
MLLLPCCWMAVLPLAAQTNRVAIFPDEDPLTPENLKLVWPATPDLRYEVKQSTNLQSWSTAPGYPATANGPAQQMPFLTDGKARFFQVRELDEQPPAIVSQFPQDGGFAVPRFANLTLQLSDATGIDTNSIRLTVGDLGTFTLTNAQLTLSNGVLTFINGGSIPLGTWGTNVQVTLVAGDTLGNAVTNTWTFSLETQPQVVTNLFVFGSPQAQRTGQRIGNIPAAALAARFGPIPMGEGEPWTLVLVESNRLELSYTNTAPGFASNTYVCNLTPARPQDIFNRKITGISDDPGNKRLTLFTVEVPLTEIATNGAATVSANSVILQTGTNGAFAKAFEIGSTIAFPRIGYSLDGAEFKLKDSVGDFDIVNLTLEEQHWWLTPRLQVALEVNWGELKRFEAIASGNVDAAAVWNADFLLAGVALDKTIFELPEALQPKTWMFLGAIGPVPVYASLGLDVKLKARAEAHATLNFRAGLRQSMDAAFGVTYNQPNVQWVNTVVFPPPEVIPFNANINAEGSLTVSLEPALEFLVYGLAGVSAGITPSADLVFETGAGQPLSGRLDADVTLDLGLAGPAFDLLSPTPELSLSLWHDEWHLFPDDPAISFTEQPQSQTVPLGGSAYFSCTVAASGTPGYQWYFNDVPMPGQTSRTLLFPSVGYGHAGNYYVRVSAGGQATNSPPATLTVISPSLQSGLVAYYPFNGNANDASGNGNNANPAPGVTYGVDRFGAGNSAALFDGTSNTYFEVPTLATFQYRPATYSAWFTLAAYLPPAPPDKSMLMMTLMGRERCYDGHAGAIVLGSENQYGYANDLIYYTGTSGVHFWRTPPLQTWTHVAMTIDSANRICLYYNGEKVADQTYQYDQSSQFAFRIGGSSPALYGGGYGLGRYFWNGMIDDVRIYNRALSVSEILQLYNLSLPAAPSGMSLIPAGSFTMGDNLDGDTYALPLHTVYVSAFYMDKYLVTSNLWWAAKLWNGGNGYSYDHAGSGKAASHPVQAVNWWDCVKWCNARSEMEGLEPCYYSDANLTVVYKTGQTDPSVKWSAKGYRLPTEAEWEKAARGGASGHRFPWSNGDTITHSQANYISSSTYGYDLSPTRGYHPAFNDGVWPYTSPVGYFAPNGYGLYDMAGNMTVWCWDWSVNYGSSPESDPRGPASGSSRVIRGGSWNNDAYFPRCSLRFSGKQVDAYNNLSFRCVRGF